MPCYRPVSVFKPLAGGSVSFKEVRNCREIKIKCGQCIGCRIDKRDMWAVRCYAESKCHENNSFITLTYDEEHFPQHGSLSYRDWQLFAHRMRKKLGPFRFFVCGEYGEELSRPHFHALVFGLDFADKFKCNSVFSVDTVYRSPTLEKLWPFGFSTIGSVTFESARYCAAYICKKRSATNSGDYYSRVDPSTGEIVQLEPEFARMSLKPGIGAVWLERYWRDIYATGHGGVVINGTKHRAPVYFDKRMKDSADSLTYEEYRLSQELEAQKYALDNTPARLAVREAVAIGKRNFDNQRKL